MRQPGNDVQLAGHAGLVQALGVADVLVAEAVDGADHDARGREAGQVDGAGGGRVGRDLVGAVELAEVGAPAELVRLCAPHVEPVGFDGRRLLAVVEHGAVEQHEGQRHLAAVAGEQGQPGSQTAAGAEPVETDAVLVDAELIRVVVGPAQRRVAVLERPRIRRLGCEPVLDGDADHARGQDT